FIKYVEAVVFRPSTEAERADPDSLPDGAALEHTEPGSTFLLKVVVERQVPTVGRIKSIRPSAGNAYYIRQILLHRPVRSWLDMRTDSTGTVHSTFREAAQADGIIDGNDEYSNVVQEAVDMH
ncbi:unnamed protein product, partial [Tilletia caries]